MTKKNVLLINPWIYDFAAYDLWMKPWGLLKISSILKNDGHKVFLLDAMDRHHPLLDMPASDHEDGTGKFISVEVEKPIQLSRIPRKYKRYGLPVGIFIKALPDADIDIVLVSSVMTYWYPGVAEAIKIAREKYKNAMIVLGGVYATLCEKHAIEHSGADLVIGNSSLDRLSSLLGQRGAFGYGSILAEKIDYGLYEGTAYGVLRLSLGCPYDCGYCAQRSLGPGFMVKDMDKALIEIKYLYASGKKIFAFYDDALLFDTVYFKEYFRRIADEGIIARFYTPNGLHARYIAPDVADDLKRAGFADPIISLETIKDNALWHEKVTRSEFIKAVENLRKAGYAQGEYSAYLLLGVPGGSLSDVREAVEFVHSLGARISLSEYSPLPGTALGKAVDPKIISEPLLHNNSVFPTFDMSDWDKVNELKSLARSLNSSLKK
ncbi:MAG: radical SAM protein [Candidatus Omnitrophica bacterium]|nr:radical SAM protein [Candidatus Omnitrophota bacterium]